MGSWLWAAPSQHQKGVQEKEHQKPGFKPRLCPSLAVLLGHLLNLSKPWFLYL